MSASVPLHGGQLRAISERFGIAEAELLDFSANINPEGPPAGVLTALHESLECGSVLTAYPDLEETELKAAIAQYAGVRPRNLAVANGFVPLLECALRTLKVGRCLLPAPAFVEYRRSLARCGVAVVPCVLASGFEYDFERMLQGGHDAVLLANPQNPSGVLAQKELVLEFVARCAERKVTVLLDEAFIDYAPGESLTKQVESFANLVVFRSVTKFHGIPGLRVAYAAACEAVAHLLLENLPPWAITTLAARGVVAALADEGYAVRSRRLNEQRAGSLRERLEAVGLTVYGGAANYLLLQVPDGVRVESFWERLIMEHRIVVRNCSNYEGVGLGYARVAVRTETENARLVRAISEVLSIAPTADDEAG